MRTTVLAAAACVALALPAAARADEVRITDPAGGTYRNGQVLTVKWDCTFLEHHPKTADEKTMEIYMRNYDTSMWVGQMATVDVLSRGYTWSIKNIPPGRYVLYGSTMPIRWDTSRIAGEKNIWLQVCWPDGKPAAGAYPAPNTGSYDWLIKETAENSLKICITTMDEKMKGVSGTFEIKFRPKLKRAMPGPLRILKR